jgi:hypothetical protein
MAVAQKCQYVLYLHTYKDTCTHSLSLHLFMLPDDSADDTEVLERGVAWNLRHDAEPAKAVR